MSFSSRVDQGYLSFAKGLVTEYNPLAPPEGTTFDELNMDVDTDGFVRVRRSPLTAESIQPISFAPGVIVTSAVWEDMDKVLVVHKLDELDEDTGNIKLELIIYDSSEDLDIELTLYFQVPPQQYVVPSLTFLRRRALMIIGGSPILIEPTAESYNVYELSLLVRDFKLLDDGLGTAVRPLTLEDDHLYNLYNSGWWQDRRLKSTNAVGDPVTNFFTIRSRYPSNADISYLGDVTNNDGDLVFDPPAYDNIDLGSTEAPRGHYIFNISDIARAAKLSFKTLDGSQLSTLNLVLEDGLDPVTGDPPSPVNPTVPPPGFCVPGNPCTVEP
jgi:hypothetical protein